MKSFQEFDPIDVPPRGHCRHLLVAQRVVETLNVLTTLAPPLHPLVAQMLEDSEQRIGEYGLDAMWQGRQRVKSRLHVEDCAAALGLQFARGPSDELRKLATARIAGARSAAELRVARLLVQIVGGGVVTQTSEPDLQANSATLRQVSA